MPRNEIRLMEQLFSFGEGAPTLEQKAAMLRDLRGHSEVMGHQTDLLLLDRVARCNSGLQTAQENQEKLKGLLEKMTATPWHPALYLGRVPTEIGVRAMVSNGNARRLVAVADSVEWSTLRVGHEVFLGRELNVIVANSPGKLPCAGETAHFDRAISESRAVLKWRDEEVIVDLADDLKDVPLAAGDLVRWDRNSWMALEKLGRAEGRRFLLDEAPDVGTECVGGQDRNLAEILDALTITLQAPEKAERYAIGGQQTILLCGPPGCGKTLMARVAAAEIARLSGTRCRFAVVKPAEWEDPYVGMTQQNIRNCFKALREAAEDGFAVLFLDEVETVGRIRGGAVGHHSDKFLGALLAELNGFQDRKNVAIVAASNRKDLIDPALLERLSDIEISVGRPDMRGAEAIFGIHMPKSVPYSPNGSAAAATRREIIAVAVSRLYSPNADNDLCVLRFRDGRTRTVAARELASGRVFEQVCREARRAALLRDIRRGEPGVSVNDMHHAVSRAMERMASTLTLRNARAYIADLPQDVDVVAVEPVQRKVRRSHQYLNINVA